ncbi:hypothetical protein H4Q26_015307 [Puccinia striiformis f. sp. tritici PST-130]|nr:hypothetical protein Pst134EB_018041 [Puccinia striiformis f. sp. tritici]KAI9622270.1 hypothetical protein H4Q26_015307 [Puccinia striiformis f. sp. tritici PST-130]
MQQPTQSSGGFKLKLKLKPPPPAEQKEQKREEEEHDQLEESSEEQPSSTKRASSAVKNPLPPAAKKRKTNSQPNIPITINHHQSDSQTPIEQQPTRPRTIKISSSKSNLVPLSDAELLSAAGAGITPYQQAPKPTTTTTTTTKKKSSSNVKKTVSNPPVLNNPSPSSGLNPNSTHKPKTKAKKTSSKLANKPTDSFQPITTTEEIEIDIKDRVPALARVEHNYELGPPPPPPVPTLKHLRVGQPPKSLPQFLPAQILEKRTPRVRSWKKVRRQIVGVSGIPFWIWTYAGDQHSEYAIAKHQKLTQVVVPPSLYIAQDPEYLATQQHHQPQPQQQQQQPVPRAVVKQTSAIAASHHVKPSPKRTISGASSRSRHNNQQTNNHHHNEANLTSASSSAAASAVNLGGPVLPASFRRPPMSIVGSPLHTSFNKSGSTAPKS